MNISLTPELERLIADKVVSGLYTTASEVVREALRLMFSDNDERHRERIRAWLSAEIRDGVAELDRGEWVDGDEAYRQVTETIERARKGK